MPPRFTRRKALWLVGGASILPASRALSAHTHRHQLAGPTLPNQLVIPQIVSDGEHLRATSSKGTVYQGGTLFVSTNTVGPSGRARVFGRTTELFPAAGGGLGAFVGFGTQDPPGAATIAVDVDGFTGELESSLIAIDVLRTQWTVDYITIPPPDPNDPDPPPPDLPDEQPRLNEIYRGVTVPRWRRTWLAPVPEPLAVSGYFGEQRSFNGGPVQGHHGGTDFGYVAGTPVSATNDGTVVLAERVRVRGYCVVVDHGGGVFSLYGHMQELNVVAGQVIEQGHVVGYVGSTGLSTGPHLHWEMAVREVLVDGLRWLDGTQGF